MATVSLRRALTGPAAVCAAGLLAVGPSLAASPAYADGQTVAFSGGSVVGMLVCRSQPSTGQVSVPAEGRVVFVNRLGQSATLRVDGQSVTTVGPNQAVPVLFHYGPVTVSMAIPCSVGVVEQFQPVTVAVNRSTMPGVTGGYSPSGGATSGVGRRKPVNGTPGADPAASADAGAAAGEGPLALPPAPTDSPSSGAVAVEPLVPASGTPRSASSGLLALVAAVCAIGVTVAAIRAIVSQRTSRIRLA